MRLPPSGNSRNPGNVATGAPGRGRASPRTPRRFFLFNTPTSGFFCPGDTESGEPGIANRLSDGLRLWPGASEPNVRAKAPAPIETHRKRDIHIAPSRPRPPLESQILPLRHDGFSNRAPEI